MSLEYALLGFLNYRPYTGYELKKIFDASLRHFWSADQSQIYRTLTRLMQQGYAAMVRMPQDDRPDRKIYHITEAGRAVLLKWLAAPLPLDEPRSASLIQVFFSARLSDKALLTKFEAFAALMRATLEQYEQATAQFHILEEEVSSPRERFFWLLTLEHATRLMRANLEWAENVIEKIKSGQVPPK